MGITALTNQSLNEIFLLIVQKGKKMAKKFVIHTYKTEVEAVSGISRLLEIGYEKNDISLLAKEPERVQGHENNTDIDVDRTQAVGQSAGAGAATGGVIGGLGELLLGLGSLTIPGIGNVLAAGPIAAALAGAAAGATTGGIKGALASMGIEKSEAQSYEAALRRGDLLVVVEADADWLERVNDIFRYSNEEDYRRYKHNLPPLVHIDNTDIYPVEPRGGKETPHHN